MAGFKCKNCGKTFKTQQGVRDHNAAAHAAVGKQQQQRQQRSAKPRGALLSQPTRQSRLGAGDSAIVTSGHDRILSAEADAGAWTTGTTVASIMVEPGIAPRLETLARAYQRIEYIDLVFEINPRCPATMGGGYVAGFIPDPADGAASLDSLTASSRAISQKWWESASIKAQHPKALLWTSRQSSSSIRLFSPGVLQILADGANTDRISIVISLRWKVRLSQPSIERPIEEAPVFSQLLTAHSPASGLPEFHETVEALFGHTIPDGTVLLCSVLIVIEYHEGAGDTGTRRYEAAKVKGSSLQWGKLRDNEFILGSAWDTNSEAGQPLVMKGTIWTVFDQAPHSTPARVERSADSIPPNSDNYSRSLEQLTKELEELREECRTLNIELTRLKLTSNLGPPRPES